MLTAFPLTTASDRCWWSHWRSMGPPDISTSFFPRPLKKGAVDMQLVESGNCFGGHGNFSISQPSLPQNLPVWHCLCSGLKQKWQQLLHPILGLGLCTRGPKSIHPAFFCSLSSRQAPRLKGD